MAAPTFVAESESAWNTSTSPKTSASLSVATGDVLLDCIADENFTTTENYTTTNSGTAQTWTEVRPALTNNADCSAQIHHAVSSVTASMTVTATRTVGTAGDRWGHNVLHYTGTDGVGATASSGSAQSVSITTTQANSSLVCIVADWAAGNWGGTRPWLTVNGVAATEMSYLQTAGGYTIGVARWEDVGAIGTYTVGTSGLGGTGFCVAAVEVKGTAGGGATNFDGTSTSASTGTVSSAGQVGKVATSSSTSTASVSSAGVVGKAATAAVAATVAVAAAGVVGLSADSTIAEAAAVTSAGSVVSGVSGTTSLAATGGATATGQLGTNSTATIGSTAAVAAAGVVARSATASLGATASVTSTGSVVAGGSASAALGSTASVTAAGVVARSATATVAASATTSAAGATGAGPNAASTIGSTGSVTAAGQVSRLSLASIGATAQLFADGALSVSRTASVAATATISASGIAAEPAGRTPPDRRGTVADEARTSSPPIETRAGSIPPETRSGTVPAEPRNATGEDMADSYVKDPADKLDYERGWGDWLASGETISSVEWTVPAGITQSTVPAASNTTTTATIWLEGGTAGERYAIGCRITTNQSRVAERSFVVMVENQ